MDLKTHPFAFEMFEFPFETTYRRLRLSSTKIFNLVQNEISDKNIYDPRTGRIEHSENNQEFESFQEILRNLNNIIYYNSLFLGSYSIFESTFKNLCKFVEKYSSPTLIYEPESRETLKECRKYLRDSKLVDFTKPELDLKYQYLSDISKLRNIIAHESGNIMHDKNKNLVEQSYYSKFKSDENLTIMNDGKIYINCDTFIKKFISENELFINLILKELKNGRN